MGLLTEFSSLYLQALSSAAQASEDVKVQHLIQELKLPEQTITHFQNRAASLITATRTQTSHLGLSLSHLLNIYTLASPQGIALMRLAESLLRIPDRPTADALLASILAQGDLVGHLGPRLSGLLASIGLPLARKSISLLGEQFILGKTMLEALKRSVAPYRYSYDMLGEAAKTQIDAKLYFQKYSEAIHAIGMHVGPISSPGISVKLSALHPRYQSTQIDRMQKELVPKIIELCALAKQYQIGLTLDAEEADRLQLSLILIKQVLASSELDNWDGFGLAVQAYQKAAPEVIDFCAQIAQETGHRLMLRLVKGAYWDSEIKRAQELGLAEYPVYTRKITTDVSYIVCAQKILKQPDQFYPQFATHNAYTIATILQFVQNNREFEFQRLHGMGDTLYQTVMAQENVACRVYAPVGDYQHLLAYLVRRLLENGANTSFVHQVEGSTPVEKLTADPMTQLAALKEKANPGIVLPKDLYAPLRKNSSGLDLSDFATLQRLLPQLSDPSTAKNDAKHPNPSLRAMLRNPGSDVQFDIVTWIATRYALAMTGGERSVALNDRIRSETDIARTFKLQEQAFPNWSQQDVSARANIMRNAADLFTEHQLELMHLLITEGKKTIPDALSEVREAIDYCRYYAVEAEKLMQTQSLPSPTGEHNELSLHARGLAVCISPWNFPLAIFIGQIVAALVTGNTVIAKPASQTPRIAQRAVQLLHQAGIPTEVLQLMMMPGSEFSKTVLNDPRIALVVFTGSLATAQHINRTLAQR
ncbi:MAG TPA: bifunctional proline dehydrogenase/L-glutamate gamma-semialdehyde dehydrogenase PutA, partial [Gammaproteobacteria bacterium]|nr:bifunctional proline dehydrogenase/L-glutamate gamma-semialdehyde dehydrogenase PutA [Gammaproteobacteria bacterium]